MAEANWYVVHTYSGYENKVKANIEKTIENRHLEEEILEVRVPMQDVVEMKNGAKKNVQKKLFPGYVLINMVMNDDTWYVVRNTRGVRRAGKQAGAADGSGDEAAWHQDGKYHRGLCRRRYHRSCCRSMERYGGHGSEDRLRQADGNDKRGPVWQGNPGRDRFCRSKKNVIFMPVYGLNIDSSM